MDKIINLNDLLKYEILDLYSAEEQIIEALPDMIENATKPQLKAALNEHLLVTKEHKKRLDAIKETIDVEGAGESGFFSDVFGGSDSVNSRGIEGLIKEAKRIMNENISEQAMDAAIIGAAQKIEHYEIAGYGTAKAWANELNLTSVAEQLGTTLKEEHDANDSLTRIAVGEINAEAEVAIDSEEPNKEGYDRLTSSVSIIGS